MGAESGAPQLVRSRVRFVHRGLTSVRLVESSALALAALASALAAAVVSGGELSEGGAWWAAGLCALLTGLAWTLQHRRTAHQVASDVDRRMAFDGALLTAWEVEGRAVPTEIGGLLARSVAGRADARRMLRVVLPGSAPVFALPFAAAVLLFLAQEQVRSRPRLDDFEQLANRLGSELGELAQADSGAPPSGAEGLTPEELTELAGLARAAGRLGRVDGEAPAELGGEVAELQRRMSELEERLPAESEIRRQLERAEDTLDSARMALEVPPSPAGAGGSGAAGGDSGDAGGGEPSGTALVPEAPDGTMTGYALPARIGADSLESGVLAGRGWPEAYDGIVARWVEARR